MSERPGVPDQGYGGKPSRGTEGVSDLASWVRDREAAQIAARSAAAEAARATEQSERDPGGIDSQRAAWELVTERVAREREAAEVAQAHGAEGRRAEWGVSPELFEEAQRDSAERARAQWSVAPERLEEARERVQNASVRPNRALDGAGDEAPTPVPSAPESEGFREQFASIPDRLEARWITRGIERRGIRHRLGDWVRARRRGKDVGVALEPESNTEGAKPEVKVVPPKPEKSDRLDDILAGIKQRFATELRADAPNTLGGIVEVDIDIKDEELIGRLKSAYEMQPVAEKKPPTERRAQGVIDREIWVSPMDSHGRQHMLVEQYATFEGVRKRRVVALAQIPGVKKGNGFESQILKPNKDGSLDVAEVGLGEDGQMIYRPIITGGLAEKYLAVPFQVFVPKEPSGPFEHLRDEPEQGHDEHGEHGHGHHGPEPAPAFSDATLEAERSRREALDRDRQASLDQAARDKAALEAWQRGQQKNP